MEVRQLAYFKAVVRTGSFSRASAEIGVAQPALSRQIRKLEDELGVRLLYRDGRGVSLTEAGRKCLKRAVALLEQIDELRGTVADERETAHGTVTLGTPPALSAVLSAPLLRRVRQSWPDINLRVIDGFSGYLYEWVAAGRIDLGILYNARVGRSLVTQHLLAEELFLIGPPNAKIDGPAALPVRRLEKLRLILPGPHHAMRREIDRAAAAAGIRLKIDLELDALQAIKELVMEGWGYSILPYGGIHAEVEDGRLKLWRLVDPEVTNEMVLAMSSRHPVTLAMQEIAGAIRDELDTQIKSGRLKGRLS